MSLDLLDAKNKLVWFTDPGVGYLDAESPVPYDEDYFNTYRILQSTPMGVELIEQRCQMVMRHIRRTRHIVQAVVDIGIGAGGFCDRMHAEGLVMRFESKGYDINQTGIDWLKDRERFWEQVDIDDAAGTAALTFWDVLEHIESPWWYLKLGAPWIFVTVPVFSGPEDARASKHYKPGEHLWYWTEEGIRKWFRRAGYICAEASHFERWLGRESVATFAFEKLDEGLDL